MPDTSFVLVTGATGQQGGATARALLRDGATVHALVRDPASPRAQRIAAAGATLVKGDLEDPASLRAALDGARGVFSVQMPDMTDPLGDLEVRLARNLAEAAAAAGVEQIVHTSVSGAGREPLDEREWGAFLPHYWRSKTAAEQASRDAKLAHTTILRPSTFMENLSYPSFHYLDGRPDYLLVAMDPDSPQPFVAVEDIGAAAAAAFADPERFDGLELELAGDVLTFREAAAILSEVRGRPVTLPADAAEAQANGMMSELAMSHKYISLHPAPARPEFARALGLPTTAFADWARSTS